MSAYDIFTGQTMHGAIVLEQGTYQWKEGVSTSVAHGWFPQLGQLVTTDISPGPGVDIAADAHDLAPFDDGMFDAVISRSVWEHLSRPWAAMHAVARVLKTGGLVFIDTHQTYPLHGYPDDYFRFSVDAMRVMMEDAGITPVELSYDRSCVIVPDIPVDGWNSAAPSYLHVHALGRK